MCIGIDFLKYIVYYEYGVRFLNYGLTGWLVAECS